MSHPLILLPLLFPLLNVLADGNKPVATDPLRPYRFVEIKSSREEAALPPTLKVKFDLNCNEELVEIIRHDWTNPKTNKVTIAVGALVRENILSSCCCEILEKEAPAGVTFSGRQFEVVRIRK